MAPKKKFTNSPTKVTVKRAQKLMKASPKTVNVKIGSSVALAQLQAQSSLVSPKQVKRPAKQTNSPDSAQKPVRKRTSITKKSVNKTTEIHNVGDSVTPQEQLDTHVTRKYVNKTTDIHVGDDSVTPQEQLDIPVTRNYVNKTTDIHSEDDSVTPQEQLDIPVTRNYVNKTTETHSENDSVTPQVQLHTPVTRKYVNKTTKIHSEDDSVTPQVQLHTPVTRKYVNKTTKTHGEDDSVTPQVQLRTPGTRKYVNKTTDIHSEDDSVTPQVQLHTPGTRKYVNKTTDIHSEDDSVTPQVQLHTPGTRKYVNKTTDIHSEDDSVTPQVQLHSPGNRKYVNKSKEKKRVDDSVKPQDQKKKRPVRKSRNLLEVKKKTATPVKKAKNIPGRKKLQKSVKSANISQESAENSSDILSKKGLAATEGCENAAIPIKRPRGRPKGSTAKSKKLSAKEIKDAAPILEKVLENPSPPLQLNNRPNSVISNKSNLTCTKDISTESSISSDTTTVISNDCVRFNNTLDQLETHAQPKVKNDNLKQLPFSEISRNESSSCDSDSSSSSSSDMAELGGTNTMTKLNLSTSSLTSKSPLSDANTDPYSRIIGNLYKLLENFTADISILGSHHENYLCTDSDVLKGVDPDLDDIINKCDNFDRDLENIFQQSNHLEKPVERHKTGDFTEQNESDNRSFEDSRLSRYEYNHSETSRPERYRQRQNTVHHDSEAKFAKPCLVRRVSAANSRDTSTNLPDKQLVSNINRGETSPTDSFKTFTSDNYNYVPFDRTHDDEDALSLYAESISGMEYSRLDSVTSVSNVSLHDVYVPKYSPTSSNRDKHVCRPTKIQLHRSNLAEESMEDDQIISNADDKEKEPYTKVEDISRACVSSSGSRDMNKIALELLEDSKRISSIAKESMKRTEAHNSSRTKRPFSSCTKMNPIRSSLYRGFCFFNIASQCKNINCRFSHAILDPNTIKCRLQVLDEDNLIAEYLLMCVYGPLKRNLCVLFVEECKRRKATRILFEMAIDLGLGIIEIDEDLRVKVLETALLHLNTISLDVCDDLLKFEHKNTMMCDALLSCMANSQNFAQFKRAFVKLANLMCELNRPVDIQVASSILERVCILPGEDALARGMLTLMENTDVSIFENNLAKSFEVHLLNIDSDVHEVYLLAKQAALEGRLAQPDEIHPATPLLMPRVTRKGPRQTSPDSTNVDNLSEPCEQAVACKFRAETFRRTATACMAYRRQGVQYQRTQSRPH